MIEVREATFVPTPSGGEIRADMRIGRREIMTSWPVEEDNQDLRLLLDRLMVQVQQVTFVSTPNRSEIRANLKVGDRAFVSILSIEDEYHDLKPLLDRLLNEVGNSFVGSLRSALQEEQGASPQEVQLPSLPGQP
jgi:hypothetical protein